MKNSAPPYTGGRSAGTAARKASAAYAPPSPVRRKRRRVLRFFGHLAIAALGLVVGFGVYTWILLGKPLFTEIPIIKPGGETVSLDNFTVPENDVGGAWGEGGRVRVYVHPDFPIERVERIDSQVENILVFGVDARSPDDYICRADSLIVLSIDSREHSIKLTSIMRDTEVDLAGRSTNEKINASYAFGGIGLLINTINQNFGLDIQGFAMFDFYSAAELIDIVGGMEIDVLPEEIENFNQILDEMHALFHSTEAPDYITEPGLQHLNGTQSIAWARIRAVGSDHARTGRQRHVIMNMIGLFRDAGLARKISFLDESLGHFETNLGRSDMMRIGLDAMQNMNEMKEYKVPGDGMYQTNPENWNMQLDWERQIPELHAFIWGTAER